MNKQEYHNWLTEMYQVAINDNKIASVELNNGHIMFINKDTGFKYTFLFDNTSESYVKAYCAFKGIYIPKIQNEE